MENRKPKINYPIPRTIRKRSLKCLRRNKISQKSNIKPPRKQQKTSNISKRTIKLTNNTKWKKITTTNITILIRSRRNERPKR